MSLSLHPQAFMGTVSDPSLIMSQWWSWESIKQTLKLKKKHSLYLTDVSSTALTLKDIIIVKHLHVVYSLNLSVRSNQVSGHVIFQFRITVHTARGRGSGLIGAYSRLIHHVQKPEWCQQCYIHVRHYICSSNPIPFLLLLHSKTLEKIKILNWVCWQWEFHFEPATNDDKVVVERV